MYFYHGQNTGNRWLLLGIVQDDAKCYIGGLLVAEPLTNVYGFELSEIIWEGIGESGEYQFEGIQWHMIRVRKIASLLLRSITCQSFSAMSVSADSSMLSAAFWMVLHSAPHFPSSFISFKTSLSPDSTMSR